jgi:hypothetical protein
MNVFIVLRVNPNIYLSCEKNSVLASEKQTKWSLTEENYLQIEDFVLDINQKETKETEAGKLILWKPSGSKHQQWKFLNSKIVSFASEGLVIGLSKEGNIQMQKEDDQNALQLWDFYGVSDVEFHIRSKVRNLFLSVDSSFQLERSMSPKKWILKSDDSLLCDKNHALNFNSNKGVLTLEIPDGSKSQQWIFQNERIYPISDKSVVVAFGNNGELEIQKEQDKKFQCWDFVDEFGNHVDTTSRILELKHFKYPEFEVGDHIFVRGAFAYEQLTHHGIYCGNYQVIDFNSTDTVIPVIKKRSLYDFSTGRSIFKAQYGCKENKNEQGRYTNSKKFKGEEIVKRAEEKINNHSIYFPFGNNCEDFSTWCVTGETISDQLKKLKTDFNFSYYTRKLHILDKNEKQLMLMKDSPIQKYLENEIVKANSNMLVSHFNNFCIEFFLKITLDQTISNVLYQNSSFSNAQYFPEILTNVHEIYSFYEKHKNHLGALYLSHSKKITYLSFDFKKNEMGHSFIEPKFKILTDLVVVYETKKESVAFFVVDTEFKIYYCHFRKGEWIFHDISRKWCKGMKLSAIYNDLDDSTKLTMEFDSKISGKSFYFEYTNAYE